MYDVYKIKKDFPIFEKVAKQCTFLDTAASAQKPLNVIKKMDDIYLSSYANVHRGSYFLSEQITSEYENARKIIQHFINAQSDKEIIFTRNCTEAINLLAFTYGEQFLNAGDEVLISQAEHHANLIPWQIICERKNAKLKIFEIADNGDYIPENFKKMLSEKTKIVAVTAMSNVLGTIFPIKDIVKMAHKVGAKVLVDACQYIVHNELDVQDLDCDFLAFSGHKLYGPTGIGVLYGKTEYLQQMPPYQFGGDMVDKVTYEKTTFDEPPARFEAGTPAIVQAIGLAEAVKYIQNIGMRNIMQHEHKLSSYMMEQLLQIDGLKVVGTAKNKGEVFAFAIDNIHPQDLAFILDKEGMAIRVGHHCAEPLVNRMGYTSLARASLGLYSTIEDIDNFIHALHKAISFLR